MVGVSPSTVQRWATADNPADARADVIGLDGKRRPGARYNTAGRDALILQRRADGLSVRAIASETGWSVGTVHCVIKAASS